MITINQLKSEIKWTGKRLSVKDMIDSADLLKKKAAKTLHINETQISDIKILKHSIDARKKNQIFQVYTLGVMLTDKSLEEKAVRKCKNINVAVSNENVYSLSSPSSLLVFEKSIVLLSILGGVPVLSLSILNPNFSAIVPMSEFVFSSKSK